MNARLEHTLQVGMLKTFLDLNVSEMKDPLLRIKFKEARGLVETNRFLNRNGLSPAVEVFTKYLDVFRQCTSFVASVATLVSLTSKSSWPVIGMTAMLPIINHLVQFLSGAFGIRSNCNTYSINV